MADTLAFLSYFSVSLLLASKRAGYFVFICVCVCVYIYIYIYIYFFNPPTSYCVPVCSHHIISAIPFQWL